MAEFSSNSYVPQQKVIDTYAPLPFESLAYAAGLKRKGVEDNMEAEGALADLFTAVNNIPQHELYRQGLIKEYTNKLSKIADEIYDKGDPSYGLKIKQLSKSWINDETRRQLESSYAQSLLHDKDVLDYKKDDKYDEDFDYAYQNFNGGDYEKGEKIKPFIYNGLDAYVNPLPDAELTMKDIAASGTKGSKTIIDKNGLKKTVSWGSEGVSADQIMEIAEASADEFATTNGGRYLTKKYKMYGLTNDEIKKQLGSYLASIAYKQVYSKTDGGTDYDVWDPKRYGATIDGDGKIPEYKPIADAKSNISELASERVPLYSAFKPVADEDNFYNEDGSLRDDEEVNTKFGEFLQMVNPLLGEYKKSGIKNIVQNMKKYYGVPGATDKQVIDAYVNIVEDYTGKSNINYVPTADGAEEIKKYDLGTLTVGYDGIKTFVKGSSWGDTDVYDAYNDKKTTLSEIMKKLNVNEADFIINSSFDGLIGLGPNAGRKNYTYYDPGTNKKYAYYIEPGQEQKAAFYYADALEDATNEYLSGYLDLDAKKSTEKTKIYTTKDGTSKYQLVEPSLLERQQAAKTGKMPVLKYNFWTQEIDKTTGKTYWKAGAVPATAEAISKARIKAYISQHPSLQDKYFLK